MTIDLGSQLESTFNVSASLLAKAELRSICRRWLQTFCPNVKRRTGRWVYNGYRWHAYSFKHESAISGVRAFEKYQSMTVEPFFVFHEHNDRLFACHADHWPDLRPLHDDIYIFPHTQKWTFITTHEMSLDLGPYFAFPPKDETTWPENGTSPQ